MITITILSLAVFILAGCLFATRRRMYGTEWELAKLRGRIDDLESLLDTDYWNKEVVGRTIDSKTKANGHRKFKSYGHWLAERSSLEDLRIPFEFENFAMLNDAILHHECEKKHVLCGIDHRQQAVQFACECGMKWIIGLRGIKMTSAYAGKENRERVFELLKSEDGCQELAKILSEIKLCPNTCVSYDSEKGLTIIYTKEARALDEKEKETK